MAFHFLHLPSEIRVLVYEYLLCRIYLDPFHRSTLEHINARVFFLHAFQNAYPLAFTCRQVHSGILHLVVSKGLLVFTIRPMKFIIFPVSTCSVYDDFAYRFYPMTSTCVSQSFSSWARYIPIDSAKLLDQTEWPTFEHIIHFLGSPVIGPRFRMLLLSKPLTIECELLDGQIRHWVQKLGILKFVPLVAKLRFLVKSQLSVSHGPRAFLRPYLKSGKKSDEDRCSHLRDIEWITLRKEQRSLRRDLRKLCRKRTSERPSHPRLWGWRLSGTEVKERETRKEMVGWEWWVNEDGEKLFWVINLKRFGGLEIAKAKLKRVGEQTGIKKTI